MTRIEEIEMDVLAERLVKLTHSDYGWEAGRYGAIGQVLQELTTYSAVNANWRPMAECPKRRGQRYLLAMLNTEPVIGEWKNNSWFINEHELYFPDVWALLSHPPTVMP